MQAPITIAIIAITALVSWQGFNKTILFEKLMLNPYGVKHKNEYYRIISHMFVHANFIHLAFNLYTFYSFGSFLEAVFSNEYLFHNFFPDIHFWGENTGRLYFILLYFLGGIVASLPSIRKHGDNFAYNAVGASGAVSAVMMAFMIMFPQFEIAFFMIIPMPGWIGAIVFLVMEHVLSRRGGTNIAHDAHIFGALFGIVFIAILNNTFLSNFIHYVMNSFG